LKQTAPGGNEVEYVRGLRRLFSFPVALASVLALLAVLTVRGRFDDPDLWWHLKMGQIIWTTHQIPLHDLFSYTTNHQALIPQEWLSEVAIYCAYLAGGYEGLMLWLCAGSALLLIAAYFFCSIYSGNAKVAFVGAMIVWFFGTIGFAIRPQLISYFLLISELLLIHAGRTRNPRWFLWLPAMFLLWINCHASFILGIAVAGVYLFTSFFEFQIGPLRASRWESQPRRMLALSFALSVAALFANPGGIKQIYYPFDTMMNMPTLMANVEEWSPLKLTEARGIGLIAVLLCCLLLLVMRKAELHFDELILLAVGTWMAADHIRMLIVFGLLAGPILSRQLANVWEGYDSARDRILPNAVMIGLASVAIVFAFPNQQNLEQQVEATSPVKALAFLRANHVAGPMLNDYLFGGYLIWAAPEYPVMMDGRTDVYEWSGFLDEYGKWAMDESDPNGLLDKYKVNFCVLSLGSKMIGVLPNLPGWKQVYADDHSMIFVRRAHAAAAGM
jgi:hypothetical protein